ncbi:MAG: hypothetical protein NTY89_23190 [Nostocales cyanobacterium LacPavin_0920_SED1_MAG_38_18]|nr:hypothetical protein [Nostocales cyanobacterium LacPavin_0920_SED1_MAG_38_18]
MQQRFAIAPPQLQTAIASPQLPKQRTDKSALTLSHPFNLPIPFFNEPQRHREHRVRAIAPPQLPKQRSHSLNSPNSDRTPPTSQTAIALPQPPQTAIAAPQLPNSDRTPSTPQIAIAPLQPPKQRTDKSALTLSHSLNFQTAIASPQLPKHLFLTNHRDTENRETAIAPLQPPKQRSHSLNLPKQRSHLFNSQTANCLQQRFAIAPLQPPKQRSHPLNSKQRSHLFNSQTAIASLQLPKSDRTPQTPQTSFLIEPQRHRGHRERAIASLQLPNILS